MNDPILLRDAIDNLVDFVQGAPQDADQRLFKRVIREAYREFAEVHPWSFYETECSMLLPSGGTTIRLRYDHATNRLYSSFPILSATNTTPVQIGLPVGFNATSGETISVNNIAGTDDGEYQILATATPNVWTLVGSESDGEGESAGTEAGWVWLDGSDRIWLEDSLDATWLGEDGEGEGGGGLEGDEYAWRFEFESGHVGQRLLLNSVSYPIIGFIDQFTVQLPSNSNPGQSIAGDDFVLMQNYLLLPEDFYKMGWISEGPGSCWSEAFMDPDTWLGWERSYRGHFNSPFRWTVMASRTLENRWEIRWTGNAGANRHISFIYLRRPADELRWSGVEEGATSAEKGTNPRIATTAGSKTVTGTGTKFSASMVGAYLRIGRAKGSNVNAEPTGLDGRNPYEELHRIAAVSSATSLTLATPAKSTGTDLSFLVSSKVDIAREHQNAFMALCQKLLAIKTQDDDRIQATAFRYRESLRLAMESDYKVRFNREAMGGSPVVPSPFGSPRDSDFGPKVPTF